MTCFWDGIIKSLTKADKDILGLQNVSVYALIDNLKALNCKTTDMQWQGVSLTNKQLNENIAHISEYKKHSAGGGYLCSTCDPFLFLVSFLLKRPIKFNYCATVINYTPLLSIKDKLYYNCNRGHIWSK